MLALQGIPGIYFHSLVGTPNFEEGVQQTGRARSINRRKFERDELESRLANDDVSRQVFAGYCRWLDVRRDQPAFHPDASQRVLPQQHPSQIAFVREAVDGPQRVLVAANFAPDAVEFDLSAAGMNSSCRDLLSGEHVTAARLSLPPESALWLELK